MKRFNLVLISSVFAVFVLCANSNAQGGPPGCCDLRPATGTVETQANSSAGDVYVSSSLLRSLSLSRGEILDRFADLLFPGKSVDLIIASSRLLTQARYHGLGKFPRAHLLLTDTLHIDIVCVNTVLDSAQPGIMHQRRHVRLIDMYQHHHGRQQQP